MPARGDHRLAGLCPASSRSHLPAFVRASAGVRPPRGEGSTGGIHPNRSGDDSGLGEVPVVPVDEPVDSPAVLYVDVDHDYTPDGFSRTIPIGSSVAEHSRTVASVT